MGGFRRLAGRVPGRGLLFFVCPALLAASVFFRPALAAQSRPSSGAEGIETNAREGQFASNQRFWFSVPAGERLRLVLDGAERYSGGSSASLELGVENGEERRFLVTAERRSPPPLERLLETKSFSVTIDRRPPLVSARENGDVFFREEGITVAALADLGDGLAYYPDLSSAVLPPFPVNVLLWASDAAGNTSVPVPYTFDFPGVRVENPVPGVWANSQRLVISGAGGGEIFWTDDGSDPLGPGGKRYRGPVLIDRAGDVTLRVASPYFPFDKRINYSVTARRTDGGKERIFAFLRSLEEAGVHEALSLPVPPDFLWSMGGMPDQIPSQPFEGHAFPQAMRGPVLRPQDGAYRTAALHLAGEGETMWRFVFALDGSGGPPSPQRPPFAPKGERVPEYAAVSGGGMVSAQEAGGPRLVYHGRSRAVVWDSGIRIRYAWDGGEDESSWLDAQAPVPVPPEGGNLRWIVERNGSVGGPFFLDCEAVPPVSGGYGPDGVSGCFAFRRLSPRNVLPYAGYGDEWQPVSGLYGAGNAFSFPPVDACDGEDLQWCFLAAKGPEEIRRADRLAPGLPGLSVPGGWSRGPVILRPEILDEDADTVVRIKARLDYESGITETKTGTGSLSLGSQRREYADVSVEAFLEDPAGNRGPLAVFGFVIDPLSVYLSARGTGGGRLPAEKETGGRDAPFRSLERALEFSLKEGRRRICVNGSLALAESVLVTGDLVIDGSFDENWRRGGSSSVMAAPGVSITVRGGRLVLRGLSVERREGFSPLFAAEESRLEIEESEIIHTGPLVKASGGSCLFGNVRVRSLVTSSARLPVLDIRDGGLVVTGSVFGAEGTHGLFLDMKGGTLEVLDSSFGLDGGRTATLFRLEGVSGNLRGISAGVSAADYSAVLDLESSALVMEGGRITASARDALAVLADNSDCFFLRAVIGIKASFVARAMEIRGQFPRVTECGFVFSGPAKRAEVFSTGSSPAGSFPEEGTIAANAFQSFTHILDDAYPRESIAGFNRRFAPPSRPNAVVGGHSQGDSP
ncbi:MAG: hypothetical protein LBI86_01430 [Treponema sp.]|jgi:hypothetical protein|nr:hypothetical protein [Treponema sp.]